jgi:nitrite reductase/ring-hydroxylating ferredoxin subunit/DMSO/TMAO reductase YedYZ heme-binding membrane subunit
MSHPFVTVQWNRRKYVYDAVLVAGIAAYLWVFEAVARSALSGAQAITPEILGMRAWGSCAFLMLTTILCIGPLARLNPRFLPLLYNRRHFGVLFFFVAASHARQVLAFYHAYGRVPKIESLLTNDATFTAASAPFQLFGAAALAIFFVMAATSHDFWQKVLGGRHWKALHMLVYAGYLLVVAHVAFGALQFETSGWFLAAFGASVALVGTLHLLAALRSTRPDRGGAGQVVEHDGSRWISAGPAAALAADRAHRVTTPAGESLAVVRHGHQISAVHGVCAHQGGPLAEGRVRNGCLTCPWHGWEYRPTDGQSPPPFTERLPTHRVRLDARGHLLVELAAQPPGTPCEPVTLEAASAAPAATASATAPGDEFFVGYLPMSRSSARFSLAAGATIVATVMLLGTVFAAFQRTPGEHLRSGAYGVRYAGLLLASPYPHLRTLNDGGGFTTLLFTGWVKNNVDLPAEKIGQAVVATGNVYERAGLRMLEGASGFEAAGNVRPGDLEQLRSIVSEDLGEVTLRGEIVDSKCYAGRMRPGVGHGHRACAQLCILGGIPPVLVTFGADGSETHYVLASTDGGRANTAVAPFAAEPVEVRGRLERRGDLRVLHVDPAEIRRR